MQYESEFQQRVVNLFKRVGHFMEIEELQQIYEVDYQDTELSGIELRKALKAEVDNLINLGYVKLNPNGITWLSSRE
jgi:hypothetical protein